MTLERHIELDVEIWAEDHGWVVRPMSYRGRRGCPDRFFFGHGTVVIIEFKKPGGVLSGNQVREIARMAKAGVTVHVIDSAEGGIAVLKRHMK